MTSLSLPIIVKHPPPRQFSLFELPHIPHIVPTDQFSKELLTITDRFELFHKHNPHIYNLLRDMAIDMVRRGVKRHGMKGLFEVLRWQYAIQTRGRDCKLNNNFTAEYARKLMTECPELVGFFETRIRRAPGV